MSDLWSAIYERVTLARQQFRAWYSRVSGLNHIEGLYPDTFWDEAPVRARRGSVNPQAPDKRRFRLTGEGEHSLLMVKHRAPLARLYFDHATQRQLDFMGRGRRDKTGKRVPIYGTMVLRTNPETLIDIIISDETLWDELRRIVMPQAAESAKRAVEWRRYWIHARLNAPFAYWQANPADLQEIIRVLGTLAAKIESIEVAVPPPDSA